MPPTPKQINITTFVQQMETTTVMKQWLTGISYECAFWNSLYRNKEQREGLFRWSNYGRELSLHNFDATSFLDERSTKIHTDAIIHSPAKMKCSRNSCPCSTANTARNMMWHTMPTNSSSPFGISARSSGNALVSPPSNGLPPHFWWKPGTCLRIPT